MKRVRLGIIGCGNFVRSHVRTIDQQVKGFQCVGLADPRPEHAKRLADEFAVCSKAAIFDDYRGLLEAVKPEAVIVSSPHTLHFRHCYAALAAGAHVMVEKPMVTNSGEARQLARKAKQAGRILQIAVQGTYTDTFAYARRLIADGTLGDLQLATGILAQGWLEGTRGTWRQDPELSGGGQLYDSTAHVLSAMVYLVNAPVREVFCMLDHKGAAVDINAVGTIRFANGTLATITSGGNCPSWKSYLALQGSRALMEVSAHGGDFKVTGKDIAEPITVAPSSFKIRTVAPVRNFLDAIRGKEQPRCPGRIGIILADLMDALYESANTKRPVRVTRTVPAE